MRAFFLPACVLLVVAQATPAQPGRMLGFERSRVVEAVVSRAPEPPPAWALESPMARGLLGVTDVVRGQELRDLLLIEPDHPHEIGPPPGGDLAAYLHLRNQRGDRKLVRIIRADERTYAAEALDEDGAVVRRIELHADRTARIAGAWSGYRGGYAEPEHPLAVVFELEHPLTPSPHVIDRETLSERFWGGRRVSIDGSRRDLAQERLFARLPAGYDPRSPAGLLIWINAGDSGEPPEPFHKALDELGIICVGAARSGNNRLISDRYQLALDAVATATRRFHIDPRRVYLTGVSGGGRTASILQGCYPDVFTGCVPIVGVNVYRNVPTGTGRFWPAGYAEPSHALLRLLRTHRIAPMTGNRDFNYENTIAVGRIMRSERLDVRVFEWPDMAHTLPTPDRFLEALSWVDEPYRRAREREREDAGEALSRYAARFGEEPATTDAQRALLLRVMEGGPWTGPAWRAAELLGLAPK